MDCLVACHVWEEISWWSTLPCINPRNWAYGGGVKEWFGKMIGIVNLAKVKGIRSLIILVY
jgi:hypothetical protein